MRFRRPAHLKDASRLTYRLWDFTGTALLNLFMILFLVAYLSPLPFMIIASRPAWRPHPGLAGYS